MTSLGAACAIACGGCTSGSEITRSGGAADGPGAAGSAGGEAVTLVERCAGAPPADVAAVRVRRDVAFAAPDGDTLRMDLAWPAGPGPHPVVLLLHGGGWEGGDRRDMHGELRLLAARGFATAAVSYRLTTGGRHVFPAAVRDARCAVRWLRANATALDLDADRVGVLGFSAGAYLASMLGVDAHVDTLDAPTAAAARAGPSCLADAATAPTVQAAVVVAGPQDLRVNGPYTAEQERLVTNFLGVFPGDAPALAQLASPIAHVSGRAAPFLLVHGTRDELVPVDHARRMRDTLRASGVPATLLELRDMGHGFPALDDRQRPAVGCTTVAFLDRWLRPRER
jgi:acetyl esterase/lipase